MPTFSQLPSGKWRVQVRKAGVYRAASFPTKAQAREWATAIEAQVAQMAVSGFATPPKNATLGDLITLYTEKHAKTHGKTKAATLKMLERELGKVRLVSLSSVVLRDFIDRRTEAGAGGVTIGADLSFLSAVLKWGRHARRLDIPERLALDARESIKHRGLKVRSTERTREPTDDELARLYAYWRANPRQRIDMPTLCDFALATAMRLGEICRLQVDDVDREAKTVIIRERKDPQDKANNDQTVPLLPAAWAILAPLIEGRTEGDVFGVRAASASTAFTRACQAVTPPVVDLHFHDLRHRAAAELFRMGLDIPRVALMTGHKSWAMLRRYTDIKPADVHAAVQAHTDRTRQPPADTDTAAEPR